MSTVIFVVACDLKRAVNSIPWPGIEVGRETELACLKAIQIWLKNRSAIIIATAGRSKKFNNVVMSLVMKWYLQERLPASEVRILSLMADAFNTDGEVRKLRDYIAQNPQINRVIVAVKWWHAPRVWWLMRYRFWEGNLRGIKIRIPWCRSEASPLAWLKEIAANAVNFFYLLWERRSLRRNQEKWRYCDSCEKYTRHWDCQDKKTDPGINIRYYQCSDCGRTP